MGALCPPDSSKPVGVAASRVVQIDVYGHRLLRAAETGAGFYLLDTPDYLAAFGTSQLHAQVKLLLGTFRYDWSMGLVLFGIHLGLLGYLIYRSGYIPRGLGILLLIAGLGWVTDSLQPYLYPSINLKFIFITFFGEVFLMLWLLLRGWKIREQSVHSAAATVPQ
jgi:hypothetical protein